MKPIRPVKLADVEALAALHAMAFAEPWNAASLVASLAQLGTFAFMAEAAGFVMLRSSGEEAEILTLAVVPAARRRGIGAALVLAGAEKAHGIGATRLFLEVAENNLAARVLYERLGFTAAGWRRNYYGAGQDALLLKAELPLGNHSQLD